MKLGLALSGGGFRASLFHIGVLARMAELDLLGKVEVLSCVSGGSIVGAMYYLLLKEMLETKASPSRGDFINITHELETRFLKGVQNNPRIHLLTNIWKNLLMVIGEYSRTERMACLLYLDFYSDIWERHSGLSIIKSIPLNSIKIEPQKYKGPNARSDYNNANTYKIPMLVINATTLNTGKEFRFTASEVGDPDLGYIRYDRHQELLKIKKQLNRIDIDWVRGKGGSWTGQDVYDLKTFALKAAQGSTVIGDVFRKKLDRKLILLGLERSTIRNRLRYLATEKNLDPDAELFSFLYDVFVAAQVSDCFDHEMNQLSLERAVAASAAVPGIFEPIVFRTLYDDEAVEVVRLSDGGVYDNQGLMALFEEDCSDIVCSDASGQLVFETDSSGKLYGVLPRTNDVLFEKIRSDGLVRLRDAHDITEDLNTLDLDAHPQCLGHSQPACQSWNDLRTRYQVSQVSFFHLRSRFSAACKPAIPFDIQNAISKIRTDLDSFSDTEAHILMYDGYYLSAHTLTSELFSDFLPSNTVPTPPSGQWTFFPPPLSKPDLLDHLKVASNRLFKVFRLWWTWPGWAAWFAAVLLWGLAWYLMPETTLNEIPKLTMGSVLPFSRALAQSFPWLKSFIDVPIFPIGNIFDFRFHLPLILLMAGLLFILYQWWGKIKHRLQQCYPLLWRGLRFIIAYKRFPLLPFALIWAFTACIFAWVHILFFDHLFLRAGEIRRSDG